MSDRGLPLPGNDRHQRVLRSVVTHYRDDPRVLAVIVFGSLGRGNWDNYSDIDLDVVLADAVDLPVMVEAARLCASFATIEENPVLIIPDGDDAVNIVLESRLGLSIRFHPLTTTSPNIIDSMRILAGPLDVDAVRHAAQVRLRPPEQSLSVVLDGCVRHLIDVHTALQRQRPWLALELLHRVRTELFALYAQPRGVSRPVHHFEAHADSDLRQRLAATVPRLDLGEIRSALLCVIDILEHHLPTLTAGALSLSPHQRELLTAIRTDLTR